MKVIANPVENSPKHSYFWNSRKKLCAPIIQLAVKVIGDQEVIAQVVQCKVKKKERQVFSEKDRDSS